MAAYLATMCTAYVHSAAGICMVITFTTAHRGGPSTFGALGGLQSWRPPPNTKYFFPPRKRNCNFQTLFCPVKLHFFHIKTTTIATMNKHEFKNKSLRKCHVRAGLW